MKMVNMLKGLLEGPEGSMAFFFLRGEETYPSTTSQVPQTPPALSAISHTL